MTTNEITQVYNVFRQLDFDGNDIHMAVCVMRTVFELNPIHRDGKLWRLDDYLNRHYGEITEYLSDNPNKPILRKLVGLIQRYNEWITRDAAPHPSVIIKAYVTLPDYIKAHPYRKDTANEIEAFCWSFNEITFGQNLNLWLDMILEQLQDDTTPLPASTGDTDEAVLNPNEQPCKTHPKPKGRPIIPLKEMMIDDSDGRKYQKYCEMMIGKKGKVAGTITLAFVMKGWMMTPTFSQLTKVFGDIGTRQGVMKYLDKEKHFGSSDLDAILKNLG